MLLTESFGLKNRLSQAITLFFNTEKKTEDTLVVFKQTFKKIFLKYNSTFKQLPKKPVQYYASSKEIDFLRVFLFRKIMYYLPHYRISK